MAVFGRIHQRLLLTGVVDAQQVRSPQLAERTVLERVHCPDYVRAFCSGTLLPAALRRMGLPWSEALVERTLAEVGGTLLTAELALQHGLACNTAGGTHHAHRDAGSGFCILNDLAVTALSLLDRGLCQRVLIVDLDVHQGDGTATLLAGEPRAFTLSLHCEDNFPARKATSSLDVPLPAGTDDDAYLAVLSQVLPTVLSSHAPDLVLYDAGVDVHGGDTLGRLALTDQGLWRREMCVLSSCLALGVPVAGLVGGGYHPDLDVLAARHCVLHRAAAQAWRDFKL